ncbi:MAG TPA: thiolase family protein [Candidatus Brocadiia bacterium]|nr:thiolase family protein [Candidatus Brocadiia bacterium]
MKDPVCIVAARRTPQGRFLGSLADQSASSLAECASRPLVESVGAASIDSVVIGCILQAGQGMNMARQVALRLGLPVETQAYTVNMMCGSGMKAVALAAQSLLSGEAAMALAGGAESMSNAPYLLERARMGLKFGDAAMVDCVLRDGLTDPILSKHMALTAESLAGEYGLSRAQQDAFAAQSHRKYFEALAAGRYAGEMAAVGKVETDEHPRRDTNAEKLATLRPAFSREGTITAGNASGINDGAAMLLLCLRSTAERRGLRPLAALTGWAAVGCDPARMGLGPVHAIRKLLSQTGLDLSAFGVIEINEAFAAQTLACMMELGLTDDPRVNPDGGAIALGHPIGASGARLIAHLALRISRREIERGLASLCIGGGMGMAVAVEAC